MVWRREGRGRGREVRGGKRGGDGRELPVNPVAFRVRHDVSWDEVVGSYLRDEMNGMEEGGEGK